MARTVSVRADELRVGQTVVATPYGPIRPRPQDWPAVTHATYRDDGHGRPVVDLELSDAPGAVFPLYPDEQVTVAA